MTLINRRIVAISENFLSFAKIRGFAVEIIGADQRKKKLNFVSGCWVIRLSAIINLGRSLPYKVQYMKLILD